ncbi:MAG: hypothetical protein QM831_08935 [Kofleriaceae bacterium]
MNHIFLGAVAFGVTLLVASFVLGGKDTDHAGVHHVDHGGHALGSILPFTSLRWWVFVLTFGGGAGLALQQLESSPTVAAIGAIVIGWLSGSIAVSVIRTLSRSSSSSVVDAKELVGATGTLLLPASAQTPGKVRIDVKGRQEDFVAFLVEDGPALPTGSQVLIVAEGDRGTLLVNKVEL